MLPSSTNSSTLSEFACSSWDNPFKSPDGRAETTPSLPQDDSNRCARRAGPFFLPAGLTFKDVLFFDCFFLTFFFGAIACFSRDAFLGRFGVAVFESFCLVLFVFLLKGMAAVYHRSSRRPQRRRDQELLQLVCAVLALALTFPDTSLLIKVVKSLERKIEERLPSSTSPLAAN